MGGNSIWPRADRHRLGKLLARHVAIAVSVPLAEEIKHLCLVLVECHLELLHHRGILFKVDLAKHLRAPHTFALSHINLAR